MNLTLFTGLLLISAGAFSAGSFAIPFGRDKGLEMGNLLVYL